MINIFNHIVKPKMDMNASNVQVTAQPVKTNMNALPRNVPFQTAISVMVITAHSVLLPSSILSITVVLDVILVVSTVILDSMWNISNVEIAVAGAMFITISLLTVIRQTVCHSSYGLVNVPQDTFILYIQASVTNVHIQTVNVRKLIIALNVYQESTTLQISVKISVLITA